jgi:predicted SAM-dependent methyltransferase
MVLKDKVDEIIKSGQSLKLHLGCGPFLFDGYVNVDGEYMKDNPNIVIHDITENYPIPDNSVDEILSVHVIEHIEFWIVKDMLKEWLRILKPGGKVIVEWPDVLKASRFIVQNPNCLVSDDKRDKKHTIHALYGNPRYKHRAMMHAYGYSIESMSKILLDSGFSTAFSEENQYSKTRADSRVVAIK